jgi:hypothetical protein
MVQAQFSQVDRRVVDVNPNPTIPHRGQIPDGKINELVGVYDWRQEREKLLRFRNLCLVRAVPGLHTVTPAAALPFIPELALPNLPQSIYT